MGYGLRCLEKVRKHMLPMMVFMVIYHVTIRPKNHPKKIQVQIVRLASPTNMFHRIMDTLPTNISPEQKKKTLLKMMFLFPRCDMLVPWRVCSTDSVMRLGTIEQISVTILSPSKKNEQFSLCRLQLRSQTKEHELFIGWWLNHQPIWKNMYSSKLDHETPRIEMNMKKYNWNRAPSLFRCLQFV